MSKKELEQALERNSPLRKDTIKPVNIYQHASMPASQQAGIRVNGYTIKYTTYLSPELIKRLKLKAIKENCKACKLVEKAIENYLKESFNN